MKKFEKYGTLLTRSEAKEIKGGNTGNPLGKLDDPEVPGGGGNNSPGCAPVQPNSAGQLVVCCGSPCNFLDGGKPARGTCKLSAATNDCLCMF